MRAAQPRGGAPRRGSLALECVGELRGIAEILEALQLAALHGDHLRHRPAAAGPSNLPENGTLGTSGIGILLGELDSLRGSGSTATTPRLSAY